ncbi:MAG: response regulator [Thiohalocapsa sp.]|nr:response regulator [Thiohalocapsa sp.]MCF7992922.1 response regulator [Thiohalocapsa sp.]
MAFLSVIERIPEHLRANPEFQSALVRIGIWLFGLIYISVGAWAGLFELNYPAFFSLFAAYLVLNIALLLSVLARATWEARRYLALSSDIFAVSLAIYLTGNPSSPFYLFYIWIFISAATRYGRAHLAVAATAAVVSYSLVLIVLGAWRDGALDAAFHLLVLILLPLYQDSLLRKLREAQRAAERANQAKSDFLANMTHELRTPLTGVLGMANLLHATSLDTEQREYTDAIASSATMLQALIGDILDLSKIDARKLHLERQPFDLRQPMKEVCEVLHTHALAKGLEIICDVAPEVPERVLGDQLRVRQILFNLIGNAVKFTEKGEVRVRARVFRASASPNGPAESTPGVLLTIEDTGIGIPADKLDNIFESFSQADDSMTRRYGGTGLGTTIARDLVQLMGGSIEVESTPGQGTRFSLRLPLPPHERPAPRPAKPRFDGVRVMIYERNATLRECIADTCKAAGMSCFAEHDIGRVSEALAEVGGIDLLIIGDSPERIDLLGTLAAFQRVLSERAPYLLLIYAQRRSEVGDCGQCCLSKPFTRAELLEAVGEALGDPQTRNPRPAQAEPPTRVSIPDADGTRVLVAEDNAIAARVISTLLERQGCMVTLVGDGNAALDAARAQTFDLAFIDLRMPGLDGLGFTRDLRRSETGEERLNIVALTANAAEDVKEACLAAGMDDFLTKPVDPTALAEAVIRYGGGASRGR